MRTTPDKALQYIAELFATEDEVLKKIRANAVETGAVGMQLGAVEAKILQLLMRLNNVRNVVEVGCFMGYSAMWMARALPEDGKLYTIEHNAENAAKAKTQFEASEQKHKIHLKEGKAQEILPTLESEAPFDMIFIDADKGGYADYLTWAEKNIRKGGLIIGDNTLLFGNVYADEPDLNRVTKKAYNSMREFNARLADENKYQSILIPTEEGMTVAIKLF